MKHAAIFLAVILSSLLLFTTVQADPELPLPRIPISGDQDGSESPLICNSDKFEHLNNVHVFQVPGAEPTDLIFDFVFREATYNNEFGYFLVDDLSGSIDGLYPGEPGYLAQVLAQATIIFPSGSTAYTPDVTVPFQGGDYVAFFLIQNSTLANLIANNPNNSLSGSPIAFFSFDEMNPDGIDHFIGFRNMEDNLTQFGFEDLTGGGDADYDDIVYNVKSTLIPTPIVEHRDVVFVRGLTSQGTCDGMNTWVPQYFSTPQAKALFNHIIIDKYLNFSYADGGNYTCPQESGTPPAYSASDTCDGVTKAAVELKALIAQQATNRVTIFGHSMGGIVAAYMVATYPQWAQEKIASVVTLDSPVKGISKAEALVAQNWPLFWECSYDESNPDNSLSQLTNTSQVIINLQSAATIVPFYHLDATKLPQNILLGRNRVRLSSGRPFHLYYWCNYDFVGEPYCEPPTAVHDTHSEVENRRFDEYGIDKGLLFGCAAVNSLDCAFLTLHPNSANNFMIESSLAQSESVIFNVITGTNRFRLTSQFDQLAIMELGDPQGTTFGPNGAGSIAGYSLGDDYETYEIKDPVPGNWHATFSFSETIPELINIGITVLEIAPSEKNISPVAAAWVSEKNSIGDPVEFSGIPSYDPDGLITRYEWDFDNDGSFDYESNDPIATHVYTQVYQSEAGLRVTDDLGSQDISYVQVRVGEFIFMPVVMR